MTTRGTTGITTLYHFNRFVNNTDDDNTTNISDTEKLRYIIDQTNAQIAQKCGRTFGSTTYKEWVEGDGTPYLVLDNYPITQVKLVSTASVDVMTIKATGFPLATVSSNNSSIVLSSIATTGTESENVFNYSEYANVSSLVTAMDDVSGWSSEVLSNNSDALTQLIRPVDSAWSVDENTYMRSPYLGSNMRIAYDSNSTLESIGGGSFCGDVFVWYVAGYTLPVCDDVGGTITTEGNVPEGLTLTANTIIKDVLDGIDEDKNMSHEKIGDYSYIRGDIIDCVDRHWHSLNQYSRKVF